MPKKLIITIDGPSGAGKSSVGDLLAARLGYIHLSTGAIYRAIGWKAHTQGIDLSDSSALERVIQASSIELQRLEGGSVSVLLDGENVTETILTNEVGMLASAVSAIPQVRQALLSLQRRAGQEGGVILDGRDTGTVVFPDADLKFYLDASVEERARRRYAQLRGQGIESDLEQLVQDITKRDHDDSTRATAPLRKAEDAVYIDSSTLSQEAVVEKMLEELQKKSLTITNIS